eukprot:1330341-Rhodomonas_salina.1
MWVDKALCEYQSSDFDGLPTKLFTSKGGEGDDDDDTEADDKTPAPDSRAQLARKRSAQAGSTEETSKKQRWDAASCVDVL